MPASQGNVDNDGCPWPSARASHSMTRIGGTIYLFGGATQQSVLDSAPLGELWALDIEPTVWRVLIDHEGTSSSANWTPVDPAFMRNCSIAWRLLTAAEGTARLVNRPKDPFPPARFQHGA